MGSHLPKREVDRRFSTVQKFSVPAGCRAGDREGALPVMADESLCTRADAQALIAARAASLWNLRLGKIGGFSGIVELLRMAPVHHIKVQLGVLVGETSLLGSATRACAGWSDFLHIEFGFPAILLRTDPFAGGPDGYFGSGSITTQTGLGVTPDQARLDRVTLSRETF